MTSNSLKEIDNLVFEFLKEPIETKALNILRCARSHNMFSLGVFLGKYFIERFAYNIDILDEQSIMLYYNNNHKEAFDIHDKALSFRGLDQDKSWKILFNQHFSINSIEDNYIFYNADVVQSILSRKQNPLPRVSFSVTTCKRFNLFEKTMNSFLNCCLDVHLIDFWLCVDDNSSEEDRNKMKKLYPFFTFYFKTREEKGHPRSMNIIRDTVKTPFLIHSEDDFKFFSKRNFISDSLDVLNSDSALGQCLFNKNYAEIESDIDKKGVVFKTTNSV